MFSKSARFHAQTVEAPGPGDYDPQDPTHRRTSGINFAADTIQRFAADKEQEFRLGPGYYAPSPCKSVAKSRRSSITSTTFADARKRLDDVTRKPSGNEDVIRELTEQLHECEKSRKAERVRAEEAQSRVDAIRALFDQEVQKRKEVEQTLSTLSLQHEGHTAELKSKFEQELNERTQTIESLKQQLETCEKNKMEADQQVVTLSAKIAAMEEARQSLTLEHQTAAKRVATLEENLKQQIEQCVQLDAQVRQGAHELENQHAELETVLGRLAELEVARTQLIAERHTAITQAEELEANLQKQSEQCKQLDLEVRECKEESEARRTEVMALQQQLEASMCMQSNLSDNLRMKEDLCVQTQQRLEQNEKDLEDQHMRCVQMKNELEKREQMLNDKNEMYLTSQSQLNECQKLSEEQRESLTQLQTKNLEMEQLLQQQRTDAANQLALVEAELLQKTGAYESAVANCQLMQAELLEKKQHINNLEAKISSTQLILSTTQDTLKTSEEEVAWMSQKMSELEAQLTSKEEQWNKKMAEFVHLEKQLEKKKATILEQKARVNKLLEDQRILQNQKNSVEKKSACQIEELQNSLETIQQQASLEVTAYQTQLNQAQVTLQALQSEHSAVLFRNEQLASISKEAQSSQERLTGEVYSLSCRISVLTNDCEQLRKHAQAAIQSLQLAQEKLQHLQKEKAAEEHEHTEEMLELHTIIHNDQEMREQHIAKLGSYEVQVSDLLARVRTAELEATQHIAKLQEYEVKLNSETSRSESLMVQLANTEMALEQTKADLSTSTQLSADLRERLLTEQHLSTDLEAKHKLEVANVEGLRDSLSQNEVLIEQQKNEIASLKMSVEEHQTLLLQTQRELSFQSSHHKHELNAMSEDLRVQNEKNSILIQSLDLNAYKLDVMTKESNERQEKIEFLEKALKQLEVDMKTRFDSMVAEQDQRLTKFEEVVAENEGKIISLTEENQVLSRTMTIEKFAHEHALNVAVTKMNETQKEHADSRAMFEERGIQLATLQQKLDAATEELNTLRQEMKKCLETKVAAEKSYTSASNSFHDLTVKYERLENECEFLKKQNKTLEEENKAECAAQIEELSAFQAERKAQQEEFETYKESVKDIMQQNEQMLQDMEKLNQTVEEHRAAIDEAATLRVRVDELETSNRTLAESMAVLETEAREVANQNTLLAGHNNQRQKINIHEKMANENRQLKLENVRLANVLHELRIASASCAVLDSENIPPEGQQLATPQSTRKNVRKLDESEDIVKTGPLQKGFQSWQKKQKQSLGMEAGKRTPLAPLGKTQRRLSLRTPQKMGLI